MKLHVVSYITRHIQAKPKPRQKNNRKVKPTVYGEVLTSDEVVERLEKEEQEKQEKAAEKAKKAAEREAKKAQKVAKKPKAKRSTKPARVETADTEEEIGIVVQIT